MATTSNSASLLELQPIEYHSTKSGSRTTGADDQHLMRLGKKPLLKRSFGFMSLLGFSCSVLITWEGILATSVGALLNGGPAGAIWGFLIILIGTLSTFATIGELASMAPVAGGQYHWVAMMAPASCRNFLSYITGTMKSAQLNAMC
jgi:choline transport protein